MQIRGTQVEILRIASSQQQQRHEIDDQSPTGHGKHQWAGNRRRISQPHDCFVDDPRDRQQQQDAVGERRQDLQALIAIRSASIGGSRREAQRYPGERQRRGVGQHMPGVGKQRQRTRQEATDDLYDREATGEHERPHEAVAVLRVIVGVMVRMARVTPRRALYVGRRALHSMSIPVYYAASQ